jgi:isochorismate hydrolase
MKDSYFIPSNIREKAQVFRKSTGRGTSSKFEYTPAKSALLVLDMQRYFLDETSHAFIPSASAIIPGLLRLISACAESNLPVFFTRHLNSSENDGMMNKWWRDVITRETPLSEIDERFDPSTHTLIEKSQYDAFHRTNLENTLREKNISQVVVTGVMTHLCCETTARSAFMRGFEVFFPVDGTATYNEDFHKASLLNLSHGFADLVLVDELLEALNLDSKS